MNEREKLEKHQFKMDLAKRSARALILDKKLTRTGSVHDELYSKPIGQKIKVGH